MTSSGRTSPKEAGEGERRCATAATVQATLPESARTLMRATGGEVVAEGARVTLCATVATGLATLLGSALRATAVETLEGRCVTDVTGLAILHGSALREMADVTLAVEAMEVAAIWDEAVAVDTEVRVTLDVAATDTEEVSEVAVISAAGVVDPSATSATGLATLPVSAGRRRTAATSATALATLRGTAARMRTPATTAMRWVTL